jgi:7-carboxy-7-deazaguanine synthase
MQLVVNEIFYSIQGESLFAGLPCVFVRLTGCNLRCSYCDTRYAYEDGDPMSIEVILNRVSAFQCPLIEITGGEPMIQEGTPELIRRLIQKCYTVLLETNGSLDISKVAPKCFKIMDVKCPGSGASHKNNFANLKLLSPNDQVKFVLTDRMDYEFAKQIISSSWPVDPPVHILFSPAHKRLEPAELAEWVLHDRLHVRLHLQLHKILWPGIEKGR